MAAPAQPDPTLQQRPDEEPGARMSFFEHLVDLRKRIINSLIAIGIGMVAGLLVSKYFINYVVAPMQVALRASHLDDKLYYTSPAGYISLVINLGLYLGIVMAMPFVLYQIWLFVAPGLYRHERRAVAWFVGAGTGLFLAGAAFGYYLALPM